MPSRLHRPRWDPKCPAWRPPAGYLKLRPLGHRWPIPRGTNLAKELLITAKSQASPTRPRRRRTRSTINKFQEFLITAKSQARLTINKSQELLIMAKHQELIKARRGHLQRQIPTEKRRISMDFRLVVTEQLLLR